MPTPKSSKRAKPRPKAAAVNGNLEVSGAGEHALEASTSAQVHDELRSRIAHLEAEVVSLRQQLAKVQEDTTALQTVVGPFKTVSNFVGAIKGDPTALESMADKLRNKFEAASSGLLPPKL